MKPEFGLYQAKRGRSFYNLLLPGYVLISMADVG